MNYEDYNAFKDKAKEYEFYETDPWAISRILDFEILPQNVLDPCAGKGVLGQALRSYGYDVAESDLNLWPGGSESIYSGMDFLSLEFDGEFQTNGHEFAVVMNPPFSLACQFVEKAFDLGARKILSFQRFAWMESSSRRMFWEAYPCSRIWVCGDRATCWRGDIPEEDCILEDSDVLIKGRKGRSTPTPHAWFVWERGHRGSMIINHLYKDKA